MNPSRASSSVRPLRVAVVGLGIGAHHVAALQRSPPVAQVCAVCDTDRRRCRRVARQAATAAAWDDFDRMLEAEAPDAVVVATPNHLHEPMTVRALEAGCHVLCEKPLAHDLAAARRIAAAARRCRRRVVIDLSYRFDAAARTAKAFLESGRAGRTYHVSTGWRRSRGVPPAPWFTDRRQAGGGSLLDLGIHRLDLGLWFLGEPRPLTVSGAVHAGVGPRLRRRGARFDVEDLGVGFIRLAGGRSLVLEASWAENGPHREWMETRVLGERGGAVHRNLGDRYEFETELLVDRRGRLQRVAAGRFARTASSPVREFIRALESGSRDVPDERVGLRLALLIQGLYRSARERREIAVAELEAEE